MLEELNELVDFWVGGVELQPCKEFPAHEGAVDGDLFWFEEVFSEVGDAFDFLLEHREVVEVAALVELFELEVKSLCLHQVGPDGQVHLVPLRDVVLEFLLHLHLRQPLFQTVRLALQETR